MGRPKKNVNTIGSSSSLNTNPSMKSSSELIKSILPTYQPADMLEVLNKDQRYAYKWLSVKQLEKNNWRDYRGWEIVKSIESSGEGSNENPLPHSNDPLDSTVRSGDLILGRMPREQADARNEFYRKKNEARQELLTLKGKYGSEDILSGNFDSRRGNKIVREEI